ncbi:glycosyltransferase family 2 protein [Brumimicrobium aurantiacum]|uniref:Glycosyltransferase n=1 Tax=Brumimicrobium aurantiacum TaxID=1737063 RepID=A0A3E1EYY9_9FLAO|nr:glycosyltransferase [Brumimicrobium aurantiacum]RFC54774.1 glycosyltransferase [Brumimicrobium aurantiacum]
MLSILIPVYNFNCSQLVKDLQIQCLSAGIEFEILVLDDTSTLFKTENRVINTLEGCSYIESEIHFGRAKIRNELGRIAQYEHLLFIDSDARVDRSDFIQNYIDNCNQAEVIIGGMKYSDQAPKENALRWHYGSQREFSQAKERNKTPYSSLISFNIMFKRSTFKAFPFDEGTIDLEKGGYGHEDTLLGLKLEANQVSVYHIDNQLVHDYQESNEGFLKNSLVAVEKYVYNPTFRKPETVQQIKIFRVFEKIKQLKMIVPLSFCYRLFGKLMKNQLFSSSPSIRLFDFYRLSYLADYYRKNHKNYGAKQD